MAHCSSRHNPQIELQRQEALTALAMSALAGATPRQLCSDAAEILVAQFGPGASVETSGSVSASGVPAGHVEVSFSVPPRAGGSRPGRIIVAADPPALKGAEMAFLEAMAEVLERAGSAYRDLQYLRYQASHDGLTGLPNRAALDGELEGVGLEGSPVAVLVCDLDGLKLVNDRLGHRRGDELLIAVAGRIRDACRDSDFVARTGGDEFVAVCPDISLEEAEAVASRIRHAVAAPIHMGGEEVLVTVSIGLAMGDSSRRLGQLIDDADADMYRSKRRRQGSEQGREQGTATPGSVHARSRISGALADAVIDVGRRAAGRPLLVPLGLA